MPPRAALTSSFSVSDAGNEVVCPLKNNDGSSCRKRCFGDKRYRSMQEHIRRAHPEHYIPKLPATEESFVAMINTPPSERPRTAQSSGPFTTSGQSYDPRLAPQAQLLNALGGQIQNHYSHYAPHQISPTSERNNQGAVRRPSLIPAASAAAALAQLHNSRPDGDWDPEHDPFQDATQNFNYFANQDPHGIFNDHTLHDGSAPVKGRESLNREALAALVQQSSYGGRSSSLQPLQRPNRMRKSSITEGARKPKHERQKSLDQKRLSGERKALSAEPSAAARMPGNSRWEDLLDAAASATEEDSRDLTPIPQSPRMSQPLFQPPNNQSFQSYTASPLQNTIMPQSPSETSPTFDDHLQPFPSVESFDTSNHQAQQPQPYHHQHQSSNESSSNSNPFTAYQRHHPHPSQSSGSNFHIPPEGLSSPAAARNSYGQAPYSQNTQTYPQGPQPQQSPPQVQHYCAACHRATLLTSSYACTECICGICRDCVDVLLGMGPDRGACPRCNTTSGRFKPFMLDLR